MRRFSISEGRFARLGKNLSNAFADRSFHFDVSVDPLIAKTLSHQASNCRLACAAVAD